MLDDHALLCHARNELADALKELLKPEIMKSTDFRKSLTHATAATDAIIALLQQSDRNQTQSCGTAAEPMGTTCLPCGSMEKRRI